MTQPPVVPEESLFSLYFSYVRETEPPIIFHRWSIITAVAAMLGRQTWISFGDGRIFPNMYVMLIGESGTRKSAAILKAKKSIARAGYRTFAADSTSREKFLMDLAGEPEFDDIASKTGRSRTLPMESVLESLRLVDPSNGEHDGIPKEVFIVADEFNEFAGNGNVDFLTTLGKLWDWDDDILLYEERFKNSKSVKIYQPTINMLGGNTHQGFKLAFPEYMIGQGFFSRQILIYSEPSGIKITFPPPPPPELKQKLTEKLQKIKDTVKGQMEISQQALVALDIIYRTWKPIEDTRLRSYGGRRDKHLNKLCMIIAAMRCDTKINKQDVILANTILTYAEASMSKAMGEFGKNRDSEAAHNIMTALYDAAAELAPRALTTEELWKVVRRDLNKREQMMDVISGLAHAGKLKPHEHEKGKWLPVQKQIATGKEAHFVDINLLLEVTGR